MKTKIYKIKTHRAYKNRQLVDGFDMEGKFDNFGNKPKIMIKTYNPITNKKRTFSNRDFKNLFHESSPNSLAINLKQLLKKNHKKLKKYKSTTKKKRKSSTKNKRKK